MSQQIQTLAVYALPILFAITLQEAARAFAAKYFGDSTAYVQGRMTLNPVSHIDPLGTILFPALLFLVQSPFLFGYAKPVPVDWGKLRHPKRDMIWVSLSAPGANFIMAALWLILSILLIYLGVKEPFFREMAKAGVLVNLVMLAVNLLPVPPLPGGMVLIGLLPHKYSYQFAQLERYGFFIVMGLALIGALKYWILPVIGLAERLLQLVVFPLAILLN